MCVEFHKYRGVYVEPAGWLSECIIGWDNKGQWVHVGKHGILDAIWTNRHKFKIFRGAKAAHKFIDKYLCEPSS